MNAKEFSNLVTSIIKSEPDFFMECISKSDYESINDELQVAFEEME